MIFLGPHPNPQLELTTLFSVLPKFWSLILPFNTFLVFELLQGRHLSDSFVPMEACIQWYKWVWSVRWYKKAEDMRYVRVVPNPAQWSRKVPRRQWIMSWTKRMSHMDAAYEFVCALSKIGLNERGIVFVLYMIAFLIYNLYIIHPFKGYDSNLLSSPQTI